MYARLEICSPIELMDSIHVVLNGQFLNDITLRHMKVPVMVFRWNFQSDMWESVYRHCICSITIGIC